MSPRKPAAPKPPTRRQNAGRGHSYFVDGVKAPGVTTLIGDGIPKPALINWAGEQSANYAVDHWDELAELTPTARLAKIKGARFETLGTASAKGTDVHALAHRIGAGEKDVEVPEHLVGYVDSCIKFLDEWDVEVLLAEVVVIRRAPWGSYMGTFDLLARLNAMDGAPVWLLDYKTGGKGIFPDVAVQLAGYADADTYLDRDVDPPVERPMPPIDRLGAVWLRADGYDLYPADVCPDDELDPSLVFAYAAQIGRYMNAPRGTYIGDAIQPPRS